MSGVAGRAVAIPAVRIAERLGLHPPTPEQLAVIEADPHGQSLVVAGAGSGKTETMANRVVWLLANGHLEVAEVLGLTFTRKAAGELAERVRLRVQQLVEAGVVELDLDPLESATVATYNAFASTIYREHALRIGREPDAAVLGEAAAFQLARSVVAASDDPRLVELDVSLDRLTGAVLGLSRAISENVADPTRIREFAREFLAMAELPIEAPRKKTPYESFTGALASVGALPVLLELAEAYDVTKRRRGFVEFSDQIALALRIAEANSAVVADYRSRYRAVLLDEYQDTSVVQTRLLALLFAEHPVMAVGDPDQSIYGWRGASAANLARFGHDFASASGGAGVFDLSTSWRNPRVVLDAANALIAPLAADSSLAKLPLAPSPAATVGRIDLVWAETVEGEADRVAAWFRERLDEDARSGRAPRTGALLCRTFANVGAFTAAFAARGVPVHVLGVAGLLEQPAVADLVCTLRVLHDPTAGAELLRVLGGARWRVGPADLAALGLLARRLDGRDHAAAELDPEVRRQLRASVAAEEAPSIVDALDFVVSAPDGHGFLRGFSEEGLERLRRAGAQLQSLRRRTGLGLIDLVGLVVQELLLDIEVAANPSQPLGRPSLDAFDELLAGFVEVAEHPTLGAFLAWLIEAEQRDRLSPRPEEPEPGAVQLLSIHASKGLEWDLVAVPRLVEGELPGTPRSAKGWLAFGELPNEFRGDADELPELDWRGVPSQHAFDAAVTAFAEENRARHAEEERRLAYVAVTRARESLLLSGSWWAAQQTPRRPSTFLRELAIAGVVDPALIPGAPEHGENPRRGAVERPVWPLDPLGARGAAVRAAASAVRTAADGPTGLGIGAELAEQLTLLLEERRRIAPDQPLELPRRVPASRFKDYVDDPAAVVRAKRRPMPERPYRATRIGTLFHAWAERRGLAGTDLDALESERDDLGTGIAAHGLDDERLARLTQTFLASPWGARRPTAVELELHLPMGETVFVCKLDAVYETEPGSEARARGIRFEIVDWKTGRAPRDARDLELKQTQLALYRLAFARWSGAEPAEIEAAFYFVEDDLVIRPEALQNESELAAAWSGVTRTAYLPTAELPVPPVASSSVGSSPQPSRSSGIGAVSPAETGAV